MATTRSAAGADRGASGPDGPLMDGLLKAGRFFTRWDESGRRPRGLPRGRPRRRRLLPRPVEPRQGGPLDARRELHRVVLVEGLRQGRDHHLGDAADRLPVGRPGPARVRAARLPARRRLLLVHLLAHPGALPVRPRRAARDVPRGQGRGSATRSLAWADDHRRPGAAPPLPAGPRQGRPGAGVVGRGDRDRRRRARPHDQDVRPRPRAPASRRSRRCRWCRTASAPGSSSSSAA